jgi:chromosome segregation ATPase
VDENMILHLREVNIAREMEVKRLRGVLMEKDREICNLYMHLSTKKKLVEEISTRFLEQLKASGAGKECSLDELNLNLDMFLFKNVVEKQKTVDELTAALGVMEREVESLEARADKFESENYRLKNAEEDLGLALESANSELVRISAENELMESSLKEKQTRVRNLMLYLEEKEEQIVRLKDSTQHNLLL